MHGSVATFDNLSIRPAVFLGQLLICVIHPLVHDQLGSWYRSRSTRTSRRSSWRIGHLGEILAASIGGQIATFDLITSECILGARCRTTTTKRCVVIAHHDVEQLDHNDASRSRLLGDICADFELSTAPTARVDSAMVNDCIVATFDHTGLLVGFGCGVEDVVTCCQFFVFTGNRETLLVLFRDIVTVLENRRELDTHLLTHSLIERIILKPELFHGHLIDSVNDALAGSGKRRDT